MRQVFVRYKVKRDRVEEHEALIRAVFQELTKSAPEGIRYGDAVEALGMTPEIEVGPALMGRVRKRSSTARRLRIFIPTW